MCVCVASVAQWWKCDERDGMLTALCAGGCCLCPPHVMFRKSKKLVFYFASQRCEREKKLKALGCVRASISIRMLCHRSLDHSTSEGRKVEEEESRGWECG